jgi:hypothetical protein
VDVQRTQAASGQHCRRQEQSIRRDHQRIGTQSAYFFELGRALQSGRLAQRDAPLAGQTLDGARCGPQAAARRAVGLREDERNVMTCVEQARQRPFSELGRAGED